MWSKLRLPAAAGLLALNLLVGPSAAPAVAASSASFSGRATVLQANVAGLPPVVVGDTGALPQSGGSLESSLLDLTVPGVGSGEVAHATTTGQGKTSHAQASVAHLALTLAGNSISTDFLMAEATATCGSTASGSSEIAGLVVNGQPIAVTGAPNQTVPLPDGGTIIINEQSGSSNSMTVNALHVNVPGVADVIVSSAHADISCPSGNQVACGTSDFVTGGGWIPPTTSTGRGNFGVAGGIKNGSWWGHLEYRDHGTGGPSVHGTGVTNYVVVDSRTRHIDGTARVNGQDGYTYAVDIVDNGTPGRGADTFKLTVSNGYTAAGTLGGGNIKIHAPCG